MNDPSGAFAEKVWITAGARFNAYRRLNGRYYGSLVTTGLMSVYVIVLQLGPQLLPENTMPIAGGTLTLLTTFLAIAILVLSLLEHGRGYQVRAERLHQSGMALNRLRDELENSHSDGAGAISLVEVVERYHEMIAGTCENHEPIDNKLFRAQQHEHFGMSKWEARRVQIISSFNTWWLTAVLVVGFPVLTIVLWNLSA